MLTTLKDKINNLPDIYYVFAAFIFIMFIAHIIFLVVNNRFNKRDLTTKEKEGVKDVYILELLFGKNKVRIFSKKEYKGMRGRIGKNFFCSPEMFISVKKDELSQMKKCDSFERHSKQEWIFLLTAI